MYVYMYILYLIFAYYSCACVHIIVQMCFSWILKDSYVNLFIYVRHFSFFSMFFFWIPEWYLTDYEKGCTVPKCFLVQFQNFLSYSPSLFSYLTFGTISSLRKKGKFFSFYAAIVLFSSNIFQFLFYTNHFVFFVWRKVSLLFLNPCNFLLCKALKSVFNI